MRELESVDVSLEEEREVERLGLLLPPRPFLNYGPRLVEGDSSLDQAARVSATRKL